MGKSDGSALHGALAAPAALTVEIRVAGGRDARRFFRRSRSISEAGIAFDVPVPIEPDRPVDVVFALPEGTTHTARAVTDGGDHGENDDSDRCNAIRFASPTVEMSGQVAAYVSERLRPA